MLKCPNPSCPYTFDPSQVPSGVVVSCPRCTMQFSLGAPAPAAPPSYAPPQFPANPELEAVGRTAFEDREPDAPPPGRRTSGYQAYFLVGIASVLMAGTVLMIVMKMIRSDPDIELLSGALIKDPEKNYIIESLPKDWKQDADIRLKAGSPYAYGFKRENPEAYVVFGAIEYSRGRSPRISEMRDDLAKPLKKNFDESTLQKEAPLETSWLGEPITANRGFKFRVQSGEGLIWRGEAYTVAHKGIAYFWVGWTGESDFDGMKAEFATFRTKFKLLNQRKDWEERLSNAVDYKGAIESYTFTDAEDIWKEVSIKESQKLTPTLDRWLRINHTRKGDRKAIPDEADLRIYLLDGGGDPLQKAREYVENIWVERLKTANPDFPSPTFTELTGEPMGDQVAHNVPSTTPVVRLESRVLDATTKKIIAATESRLIVVSAIRVGDKIVVLHCWCEWPKRDVFEARFVQIASSLR